MLSSSTIMRAPDRYRPRRTVPTLVAAVLLAALALPLAADDSASEGLPDNLRELRKVAAEAEKAGDLNRYIKALQKMQKRRPYSGGLMFRLAEAYARAGQQQRAYHWLFALQRQGLAYDPGESDAFDGMKDTQAFQYLQKTLSKHDEPFGEAEVAQSIPAPDLLTDGIAYDPHSERWLVGSARYGTVFAVDNSGQVHGLGASEEVPMWSVLGVAVDADRGLLWVSSSALPLYAELEPEDKGRAGVYAFDLTTGELKRHALLPADSGAHTLADLAVTGSGDVYVLDSLRPAIYRLAVDGSDLEPVVASKRAVQLNALTVGPDDDYLFFADYALGLYRMSLDTHDVERLGHAQNINVGGIDSLSFHDGSLIAVQNGVRPTRVQRYTLNEALDRVVAQQPMLANHPSFDSPSAGAMTEDGYYLVPNSHWERITAGEEIDARKLSDFTLLKVDLPPKAEATEQQKFQLPQAPATGADDSQ